MIPCSKSVHQVLEVYTTLGRHEGSKHSDGVLYNIRAREWLVARKPGSTVPCTVDGTEVCLTRIRLLRPLTLACATAILKLAIST